MKREAICTLLGVTQLEMAMLLRINRTQWSMFELGKRDLPLAVKLQLADMVKHMKSREDHSEKQLLDSDEHKTRTIDKLELLLINNLKSQVLLDKKIARIEKKRTAAVNALHLLKHLESQGDKQPIGGPDLLIKMQKRAGTDLQPHALSTLAVHQLKQQVLQHEEKLLKDALKKLA